MDSTPKYKNQLLLDHHLHHLDCHFVIIIVVLLMFNLSNLDCQLFYHYPTHLLILTFPNQ